MLSRLRRRRERTERIEAQPKALVRDLGVDAYSEARHRERHADSAANACEWGRIAMAVAQPDGQADSCRYRDPYGGERRFHR